MTVNKIMTLIAISKIVLPVLSVLLFIIGIKAKRKIITTIAVVVIIISTVFYTQHDCLKYVEYNCAISVESDGTVRNNGFCIICNQYITFENGIAVYE